MGTASERRGLAERLVSPQFRQARRGLSSQQAEITRQQALLNEQRRRLSSQEVVRATNPEQRRNLLAQIKAQSSRLGDFSSQISSASQSLATQERSTVEDVIRRIVKAQSFSAEQAISNVEAQLGQTLGEAERTEIANRVLAEFKLDIPTRGIGVEIGADIPASFPIGSRPSDVRFTPISRSVQDIETEGTSRSEFQVRDEAGNIFDINQQGQLINQVDPTQREQFFQQSFVAGVREQPITLRERIERQLQTAQQRFQTGDLPGAVRAGAAGFFGEPIEAISGTLFPFEQRIQAGARQNIPGAARIQDIIGGVRIPRQEFVESTGAGLFFLPGFGAGTTARQTVVRKSFSEIAREQLAGLRNQFERGKLGGETGRLARTGFKNNVRAALEGRSEAEIRAFRELIRQNLGEEAARLVDEALIQQITFVRPTREIIKPGAQAQLPSPPGIISPRLGDVFDRPGAFAGTGQFERTTATIPRTPLGQQLNLRTNLVGRNQLRPRNILGFQQSQLTGLGLAQLSLQPQVQRDTALQRLAQQQRERQRQLQRARLGLGLGLGLTSAQQLLQQQRARLRLGIPTPRVPRQPGVPRIPPARPIPPPVLLPGQAARIKKNLAKLKRQAKVFDVFVKRGGKFEKVANDLPFGKALKKGSDITRDTLAAQFKVVPDKKGKTKLKDIKFRPKPEVFRDFKIKNGVAQVLPIGHFIERRNKRITSGGEISEIVRAQRRGRERKKRGRKRNPFGL